ncbi:hypothetical protein AB1Y20_009662 [Prymnesium parvum]|uniref:Major facilitator superfamily (MFS) profile domain-containing protein n=1 Tax=Prymnesium parvum TaxID=97485 RepID=A0AB34K231_PRYPA
MPSPTFRPTTLTFRLGTSAMCHPRHAQPFPWPRVLILLLVNVSEPLAITLCFPIAPFMVADWVHPDSVGVWAGALASVYSFAGIPSNVAWGWLSDRAGRRATLTVMVVGTALMLVGFGLSGSLVEAIFWRTCGGIFSGIGGVCRAALAEVTTASQRGRAFSLLGWTWSIGLFVGPMIGGLLSRPADSVPALRGGLLESRPYLLPCVASTLFCAGGVLALCSLRESPPAAPAAPAAASADVGHAKAEEGAVEEGGAPADGAPRPDDGEVLLRSHVRKRRCCRKLCRGGPSCVLLCSRLYMLVYVQGLVYLAVTGMSELFPLLCERAARDGGLGLRPAAIGAALVPLSLTLLVTPLLYPHIEAKVGHYGCFRLGATLLVCATLLMSLLPLLRSHSKALLWVGICTLGVLRGGTGPLIFCSTSVIFNNMLVSDMGYWNGLSSSCSALCRGLAPVVFGSIFAFVQTTRAPFPFDGHLPFLLIVVVIVLLVILVGRDPNQTSTRSLKQSGTRQPSIPSSSARQALELEQPTEH